MTTTPRTPPNAARRARIAGTTDISPAEPVVVKPPYVGRLITVSDWHRQVAKVFREMRKGLLPKEDGTRLTYVAQIGASLAKVQDELRALQSLRAQLERIQAAQGLLPYSGGQLDGSPTIQGEYLPAASEESPS